MNAQMAPPEAGPTSPSIDSLDFLMRVACYASVGTSYFALVVAPHTHHARATVALGMGLIINEMRRFSHPAGRQGGCAGLRPDRRPSGGAVAVPGCSIADGRDVPPHASPPKISQDVDLGLAFWIEVWIACCIYMTISATLSVL